MDLLVELRELALASRLRRLSESMMEEGEALYRDLGFEFRPRWFPLFYALCRMSSGAITELGQSLGLSHTAVKNIADEMLRAGLISQHRDANDDRKRILRLSLKGRKMRVRLQPVWKEIRLVVGEVLAEAGVDLMRDIARFEKVSRRRSIMDRVRERFDLPAREALTIVDYRPAYKKHFKRLNEEWLRKHFTVEKHDAEILDDPNGRIVKKGGIILFALLAGEVAGTCAVIRHRGGKLELCKMAVAPEHRGRGVGAALGLAAMERARASGAGELFLQTSASLRAAGRLYRRLGFRRVAANPLSRFECRRRCIAMRVDLKKATSSRNNPAE